MNQLAEGLITQSNLWQLRMLLTANSLEVLLVPPVETETAIYRRLPLSSEAPTAVKAVEEAIYDNPLLLSDFKAVSIMVDTPQTMAVPAEVAPADYEMLMRHAFGLDDCTFTVNTFGNQSGAVCLMAVDRETKGFLQRTFYNAKFFNHLTPLTRTLSAASAPKDLSMDIGCRPDAIDLIALDAQGSLLSATTFECRQAPDALFFAASTAHALGHNLPDFEITIFGDPMRTVPLQSLLGQYVKTESLQMPALPFRLPSDAASIPLQLLLPCE